MKQYENVKIFPTIVKGYPLEWYRREVMKLIRQHTGKIEPLVFDLFPSYLSPKARIGASRMSGKGIISYASFRKGELVAIWGGHLMNQPMYDELLPHMQDYPVQVWTDFFLGPTAENEIEIVDHMNHSCNPTCVVMKNIFVVAKHDIPQGEELTFDYGTTDTSSSLYLECSCGSPNCRKVVTSNDWMKEEFLAANYEFLSDYIKRMVKNIRKQVH